MTQEAKPFHYGTHRRHSTAPALLVLLAVLCGQSIAQLISGTISGTVVDPTDAAVADASVILTNDGTKSTREAKTDRNGVFAFAALQPGSYTIRISAAGFTTVERTGNILSANSYR